MTSEIKRGKFRDNSESEERAFIAQSTELIKRGECDYCLWTDLLVMGDFDENECLGIYVARVIRHIES